MAPTTEIHIPASPDRRFANMLFFLISSIAAHAALPGPWTAVVTLGRDGDLTPASPEFAWARDFPVEFRVTSPALWDEYDAEARRSRKPAYVYNATIMQQFTTPFTADAVIFMDADTVVTGPLGALVNDVLDRKLYAAKPAWQPPPIDLDAILAHAGLVHDGDPITYSGYGWSFLEPRLGPPYLNGGFIVCTRDHANILQRDLPGDFHFVTAHYPGHFVWQVANCLTIIRSRIPLLCLDERYNMGIGEAGEPLATGAEGARLVAEGLEQVEDRRVLHYCTPTAHFHRGTVMNDDALLRAFCLAPDLNQGEAMLQSAFRPFLDAWERRQDRDRYPG